MTRAEKFGIVWMLLVILAVSVARYEVRMRWEIAIIFFIGAARFLWGGSKP